MTFPSEFSIRHIPAYTQTDILWWLSYTQAWNGIQILEPASPLLHVHIDASSPKGLGGIFGNEWFSTRCPHNFRDRDITFKELYAVLQAIMHWGLEWCSCHIVFHVDNSIIVLSFASGTNWNAQVMNMLKLIIM